MSLLLTAPTPSPYCAIEPTGGFFWLFEDGSIMALEDCSGGWLLEGQAVDPAAPDVTPSGGWRTPPGYERHETAEMRRLERERLGIIPKQQRAIDRAAVKIAASIDRGGLLEAPAIEQAPAFDALLAALRPTAEAKEGMVAVLVQAILDRIAWMQAETEDEEAIVRIMMEMD